ncbi:TetR family transcriptional regulator [Microbacterium hydrocarbonoxydans]|uniref:TetR/AcrR family transcriptional regulator n=1 Tax=Microbacterium hydrocarbonoxydans TaxID=273678 RepID=UPI0013D90659|nr:TetR family transcriptional regulator [Microbacterium hydrocarbonoxydans]
MTEHAAPRRRGRPRGGSDSRERIIGAAVDEFGEHGYDGSTIRSIAARAGVDSALVHHYFGTKADLFAEAVGIPLRPDIDVPGILDGPRDQVGERLVRYVLEAFEQPDVRRRGVMLMRTAIGSRLTTPLLAGFLSRELIGRIAKRLGVEDAELRATLVASQIAGMLLTRYVLKLGPIAAAPVDELVARIAPTVQRYLFA